MSDQRTGDGATSDAPVGVPASGGLATPANTAESARHDLARPILGGRPRPKLIFAVAAIAMMMSSIDQTIVATALPSLQRDLGSTAAWAGWTITVYALGRVLVLPLAGRLSDLYGRRRVMLSAVALFTAASLACGLVNSIYLLVSLRAVQAIGGAAFVPSSTGVVADYFGRHRGRAVGLFTSIVPLGGIIGPILGGYFVTYWSWRGIFLVNVPIGVLVVAGVFLLVPSDSGTAHRVNLDVVGMLQLGAGVLLLMVGVTLLGSADVAPWTPRVAGPALLGLILLVAFLRHVHRVESPFISPRLLHGHSFGALNVINFLYGGAALGFAALVPLYAVDRYGISYLASGTLLNARAVGAVTMAGVASWTLPRTGYRWPLVVGFVLTSSGLFALALTAPTSPYMWLAVTAAVTGIGMGATGPASMNASLQFATQDVASVASLRQMLRQSGSITAISVATALVSRSSNGGLMLSHVFQTFSILLLCIAPLVFLVPEHRGDW